MDNKKLIEMNIHTPDHPQDETSISAAAVRGTDTGEDDGCVVETATGVPRQGRHLPPESVALIREALLVGCTNREVTQRLRLAGLLGPEEAISNHTLARYRQDVHKHLSVVRFDEEAMQVATSSINQAVKFSAEIMRALDKALLAEDGSLHQDVRDNPQRLSALGSLFQSSVKFLWLAAATQTTPVEAYLRAQEAKAKETEEVKKQAVLSEQEKKALLDAVASKYRIMLSEIVSALKEGRPIPTFTVVPPLVEQISTTGTAGQATVSDQDGTSAE